MSIIEVGSLADSGQTLHMVNRCGSNRKESGQGTHSEVRNKNRWTVDRDVICRVIFYGYL